MRILDIVTTLPRWPTRSFARGWSSHSSTILRKTTKRDALLWWTFTNSRVVLSLQRQVGHLSPGLRGLALLTTRCNEEIPTDPTPRTSTLLTGAVLCGASLLCGSRLANCANDQTDARKSSGQWRCADTPEEEALVQAVERGQVEEVKTALKKVNPDGLISCGIYPRSILTIAAAWHPEILGLLLEAGARPENNRDFLGETPLCRAVTYCRMDAVKALIPYSEINRRGWLNDSPLKCAAVHNCPQAAELLIAAGAAADEKWSNLPEGLLELCKRLEACDVDLMKAAIRRGLAARNSRAQGFDKSLDEVHPPNVSPEEQTRMDEENTAAVEQNLARTDKEVSEQVVKPLENLERIQTRLTQESVSTEDVDAMLVADHHPNTKEIDDRRSKGCAIVSRRVLELRGDLTVELEDISQQCKSADINETLKAVAPRKQLQANLRGMEIALQALLKPMSTSQAVHALCTARKMQEFRGLVAEIMAERLTTLRSIAAGSASRTHTTNERIVQSISEAFGFLQKVHLAVKPLSFMVDNVAKPMLSDYNDRKCRELANAAGKLYGWTSKEGMPAGSYDDLHGLCTKIAAITTFRLQRHVALVSEADLKTMASTVVEIFLAEAVTRPDWVPKDAETAALYLCELLATHDTRTVNPSGDQTRLRIKIDENNNRELVINCWDFIRTSIDRLNVLVGRHPAPAGVALSNLGLL